MLRPPLARPVAMELRLSDLTRLRRVKDRIDREYARPLDVAAPSVTGMESYIDRYDAERDGKQAREVFRRG